MIMSPMSFLVAEFKRGKYSVIVVPSSIGVRSGKRCRRKIWTANLFDGSGRWEAFANEAHQNRRFARPLETVSTLSGCPTSSCDLCSTSSAPQDRRQPSTSTLWMEVSANFLKTESVNVSVSSHFWGCSVASGTKLSKIGHRVRAKSVVDKLHKLSALLIPIIRG